MGTKILSKDVKQTIVLVIIMLTISVILLIYSYIYRKPINSETVEKYKVTISNAEYHSGTSKSPGWVSFSCDLGDCYISPRILYGEKLKELTEVLNQQNKEFTVSVTNQHRPIQHIITYEQRIRVVQIEADNVVIFSLSDFNSDVVMDRIGFTVISVILIVVSLLLIDTTGDWIFNKLRTLRQGT